MNATLVDPRGQGKRSFLRRLEMLRAVFLALPARGTAYDRHHET
jgi:hypothetical protein